eukprot:CAMPEP_0182830636 /NCGR_PEP_ID=MMETSP0006_2-20121128/18684_1 /TAXON_ID=97485 /ORGANISM="Prymnesium parvum, Strain Texoma1" /LENGTH=76 /DNA_ID=CAMNT_0024958223 /DNA_START=1047 /DNA_END=1277 /DNA_ORIENTATION=-
MLRIAKGLVPVQVPEERVLVAPLAPRTGVRLRQAYDWCTVVCGCVDRNGAAAVHQGGAEGASRLRDMEPLHAVDRA